MVELSQDEKEIIESINFRRDSHTGRTPDSMCIPVKKNLVNNPNFLDAVREKSVGLGYDFIHTPGSDENTEVLWFSNRSTAGTRLCI